MIILCIPPHLIYYQITAIYDNAPMAASEPEDLPLQNVLFDGQWTELPQHACASIVIHFDFSYHYRPLI